MLSAWAKWPERPGGCIVGYAHTDDDVSRSSACYRKEFNTAPTIHLAQQLSLSLSHTQQVKYLANTQEMHVCAWRAISPT